MCFHACEAQDAEELGVIFIGTENNGYSAKECVPQHSQGNKWKCGVTVTTPQRQFVFMCEQEREQKEWLDALRQVLSRPMAPQDYSSKQGCRMQSTRPQCKVGIIVITVHVKA